MTTVFLPSPITVRIACIAQDFGTLSYAVTSATGVITQSGVLGTNSTQSGTASVSYGSVLAVTNISARAPRTVNSVCIDTAGTRNPIQETCTFHSFTLTYANLASNLIGTVPSITFRGTPCPVILRCTDPSSSIACAGSLEVVLTGITGIPVIMADSILHPFSTCSQFACGWASGDPTLA